METGTHKPLILDDELDDEDDEEEDREEDEEDEEAEDPPSKESPPERKEIKQPSGPVPKSKVNKETTTGNQEDMDFKKIKDQPFDEEVPLSDSGKLFAFSFIYISR